MDNKEINFLKLNNMVFTIGDMLRGTGPISSSNVFGIIYTAYVINSSGVSTSTDLEKYVENNMTADRLRFISQTNRTKYGMAFKISELFAEKELLAYLFVYPKYEMRFEEESGTPESINRLAIRILDLKESDSVADFGSGVGEFLLAANNEETNAEYFGVDINFLNKEISEIRSELFMKNVTIRYGNMFDLEPSFKFEKIFSNYPFGMKLASLQCGEQFFNEIQKSVPEVKRATSSDWIYNALLVKHLKDNGKAVAIMTNGSTMNSTDLKIRKYFVENGLVEAMIALPTKMFGTTQIATTMIVLSKNNSSIRMIDARRICEQGRRQNEFSPENVEEIYSLLFKDSKISKIVNREQLEQNDFVLSPPRYLDNSINITDGVEFGTLIRDIKRGAPLKASELDEMASDVPTNTQYLMLSNIQNGQIDKELPYLKELDSKLDKYCIRKGNLLLSKNGAPYKVAIAENTDDQKILANGNLFVIQLDEDKVNPYFIKAFFDSDIGESALKRTSVGTTIPNISAEALKKMIVPLPAMEEQNIIAKEYVLKTNEIKELTIKLQKARKEIKELFE